MIRRAVAALCLALLSFSLPGCGSYQLKGRVIPGDFSMVEVVDSSDPRLYEGAGVPGASIVLETDPERLGRKVVGTTVSGAEGDFATPFSEPGGGFLIYDVGVNVSRPGYQPARHYFQLPGSSKRLLVTLAPGEDRTVRDEDPYDQYKRFKKE